MHTYKRKIIYLDKYENGEKGKSRGYLKLEVRNDKVKLSLNINDGKLPVYDNYTLYFYYPKDDTLQCVKVAELSSQGQSLEYKYVTPIDNLFQKNKNLYSFSGVALAYNENYMYLGDFEGNSVNPDILQWEIKKKASPKNEMQQAEQIEQVEPKTKIDTTVQVEPAVIAEETKPVEQIKSAEPIEQAEQSNKIDTTVQVEPTGIEREMELSETMETIKTPDCETCKYKTETGLQKSDMERMFREYPKLPMYENTELYDCVRIEQSDIGLLEVSNWRLGSNSFLSHGYYTYKYLMLGKIRLQDGKDRIVLGVPGIYANKEKYLANMFGFDLFVPIKKTPTKTGQFGYWIVEINPNL